MTASGIVGDYMALKRGTDSDLLAMQLGDFYEFFDDDAKTVAEELDLTVSRKSSGGETYPMAGVPVDQLTPYLTALVERGYRVAVADQHEDGDDIEREVVRVATPGTLLETDDADARYLAAVVAADGGSVSAGGAGGTAGPYGLALADVTTGRFLVTEVADVEAALTELYRFDPVEVLPGPAVRDDDGFVARLRERDATLSLHEAEAFAPRKAARTVREQFGEATLESLGIDEASPQVRAAGGVVDYVAETGVGALAAMTRLQPFGGDAHVALDATTQRNLELLETMGGDRDGSLVDAVDHTATSAGGRLLREWLVRPTRDRAELHRRQDGVAALGASALAREEVREVLADAYDLQRLASRATGGRADAGDLLQVRDTLGVLPALRETVSADPRLVDSPVADALDRPDAAAAEGLREELAAALAEDPPATVTDGGLVRRGYDDELDELVERHEELRSWFDGLADRVSARHGLTHVTVDRNKTDGYYVQVGESEADRVPERFEAVKTLKNSERFTFDELEDRERELLRLEERRGELERAIFESLRERVAGAAELLQTVGRALAEVDVLASFASHAVANDWTRPTLHDGDAIEIERGRHPVVEQTTDFVPNDATLTGDRRFLVVTGPNMSGKSTYLRQTALVVLLAQVGSFVPADAARVGLVDGVFTRVGALDELAQGRSTFMVEMQELSNILHSATDESLVILDEVGRGTATYDGISIAWAATEYLVNRVGAKTLFATHYHELTVLGERLAPVENVHVTADERDGDVTFLRTVEDGAADRSYGIHVADLAGVPTPVVDRARDVLARLREEKAIEARGGDGGQQVVFDLGAGEMRPAGEPAGGDRAGGSAVEDLATGDTSDGSGTDTPGDAAAGSGVGAAGDGEPTPGDGSEPPDTEAVLAALRDLDLAETPPVDVVARVREWQRQLEEE